VRIDSVTLCANEETNRAFLFFRASATSKHHYASESFSPNVVITLLGARDEVIYEVIYRKTVPAAIVQACGGYQPRVARLAQRFNVEDVGSISIRVIGGERSRRNSCQCRIHENERLVNMLLVCHMTA
jgi:hypothetical protein